MDKKLSQMKGLACRGDELPLTETEIEEMMAQVPDWKVVEEHGVKRLKRTFRFRNFMGALKFTNQVGEIAEGEGHHPVITLTWGKVTVIWYTHKVNGLHDNDFIMAAKTDDLLAPGQPWEVFGGIIMPIGIVTDSTCDLPEDVVAEHGISVVPLYINVGDESYLDGVDLSRQEFYDRLPGWEPPPQTATPSPGMFRRVYERLADEGITEILSIHISISLSATVDSARLAAEEITSAAVTVFDGGQVSLGTGLLALAAAKAAAAGHSIAEIVELLKEKMLRTHVFAALDTLEFLQRSGRMNWAVSRLGTILRIKPLLKMHNGDPQIEKIRTSSRAIARMIELVKDLGPLEELALIHTHAPEKLEMLYEEAKHLFPRQETPLRAEVTPVIGTHVGPGAVGFACVAAADR